MKLQMMVCDKRIDTALTCGRHCASSIVEAWYAKVGVTLGPYPSQQRGLGINQFRRQRIIAVEELSCCCQWSHSDEIGILVLPRHRLCAVAGCSAAAKLPAGLAAWDGRHGLIWQAVTHDALWAERLTQFWRLELVLAGGGVHVTHAWSRVPVPVPVSATPSRWWRARNNGEDP
jgi:hypothetical protein